MIQGDNPLRHLSHLRVVGDDNQRGTVPVEFAEDVHHDVLVGLVQIPRGFVRQNQLRIVDQRPGNAHPLLFTARELTGQMPRPVRQTHPVQGFQGLLLVRQTVVILSHHDVLHRRQVVDQVELLENQTDFVPANLRQGLGVLPGDIPAIQQDLPGGGPVHTADDVHQGALAGAGRPHDRDPFALVHMHVHIVQGFQVPVNLGYAAQFQQTHTLCSPFILP